MKGGISVNCPVGIWCQNDVVSTSMRRHHVASTLIRRHFYVMCPLGKLLSADLAVLCRSFKGGGGGDFSIVNAVPLHWYMCIRIERIGKLYSRLGKCRFAVSTWVSVRL